VAILALATMALAADYPGAYFDLGSGEGAASAQVPSWSDLMGVLEACAVGHDCTITVARGERTFYWTAYGPLLALTDAAAAAAVAADPSRSPSRPPAWGRRARGMEKSSSQSPRATRQGHSSRHLTLTSRPAV
jgi:hypothetical protein